MTTSIRSLKTLGAVLAAAFALAAGCDAKHVLGTNELGGPDAGAGAGGQAGASAGAQAGSFGGAGDVAGAAGAVAGSTGAAGLKAGPLGPLQSWTGYIEQLAFLPSGSDQIKLTFAQDSNGVVAGTVVFGMGTPPPPATDPNVGYPADVASNGAGGAPGHVPYEGYSYTFDGGTIDTHRLRFTVNLSQLWAGWCALQTQAVDGTSGCLPNWSWSQDASGCHLKDPKTNKVVTYDCGKVKLCTLGGQCACGASGCTFTDMGAYSVSFDMFSSGDTMSGSAWGFNVHFVRD
jgi:hypothetical protein